MPRRLTFEEAVEKFRSAAGDDYQLLSTTYTRNRDKLEVLHVACGRSWMVNFNRFVDCGDRCPRCNVKSPNVQLTSAEYRKRVEDQRGDEYVVLEDYVTIDTKILHRHRTCGHEWRITPNNFFGNKQTCPVCVRKRTQSRGAEMVEKILKDLVLKYEVEKTMPGMRRRRLLRFDFYLPELNAAIEYDYDHSRPFSEYDEHKVQVVQERDSIKDAYCLEHGIPLLRILKDDNLEYSVRRFIRMVKEGSTTIPQGSTPQANGGGNGRRPQWAVT